MTRKIGSIALTNTGGFWKKTGEDDWNVLVTLEHSVGEASLFANHTQAKIIYEPSGIVGLGNGSIIESTQESGVVAIRYGGLWSVVGVTRYYNDEEVHKLFGGQYEVVREVRA